MRVLTTMILTSLFVFLTPAIARAQTVNIETNPKHPSFGDTVLFTATGFGFDIGSSNVVWKKNGEIVASGVGQTIYSETIDKNQTAYSLSVETENNGNILKKIYRISPFYVDLLWEVKDGYTPPFYKGKTLPVRQSNVLFHAIADKHHSSKINFTWEKGAESQSYFSGQGRNTFSVLNDLLYNADTVSVVARNPEGVGGADQKRVEYRSPEVVFYPTDEIFGVDWSHALRSNQKVTDKKIKLTAIPYHMTISEINDPNYEMNWIVDGSRILTPDKKNQLTLQNLGKGSTTKVGVSLDHKNRLYQDGEVSLPIIFGSE